MLKVKKKNIRTTSMKLSQIIKDCTSRSCGKLVRAEASIIPFNIYLFKFNNRNTRKMCENCSKMTIKTPERRQCCCDKSVRILLQGVAANQ